MTKAERVELAKLARMRAKVARTEVDQRAAELRADVERQLSATYQFGDEAWRDVTAAAQAAVAAADEQVAAKCRELGIPDEFRPRLTVQWYRRGENAAADRRAELRKTANAHIEAQAKAAKTTIEARSLDVQTELMAGGLTSGAARQFLAAMPTPAALMPTFDVVELRSIGGESR